MIKNERQYRITKAQANGFAKSLEQIEKTGEAERRTDPLRFSIQESALRAQLSDLRDELSEYEALRANPGLLEAALEDLPRSLIRARIASGLSHQQLAARLNLKEQQIQRYEATDYEGVSIDRIGEICRALGIHIHNRVVLPTTPRSAGQLFKKLQAIGLNSDFVRRRLIPSAMTNGSRASIGSDDPALVERLTDVLGRVFNWTPDQLYSDHALSLENAVLANVRYKSPAGASIPLRNAYTIYAHYLALLVLQCVRVGALQVRSSDPRRVHDQIVKLSGEISIDSVLDFVWDCGIPVIPLRDPGAFHGAWWRIDGQDIIVVKQSTSSTARWIIDILHEYFHSATEPDSSDGAIVEERESTDANSGSEAEQLATEFAVRTALNERQEQLAEACVKAAHGKVEWLKSAVPQVAARENVDLAMLANYMAYRLSFQDINWWPTAQGLQSSSEDPWKAAASKLLQRLEMDRLAPADRDLLIQALA